MQTVLVLAMLNVILDVRTGAPPLATLKGLVEVSRKIIEIIDTPPETSVVAPPPTIAIADPEPTTTQIGGPCFVFASPSRPPSEGCTTVWAVQLVAYDYNHVDIAQAERDQLRKAGMTDVVLIDSSVFLSLCPGHLLLMQPTFGSEPEAAAAALSLQTRAGLGESDIVPLAPDSALRTDPDCT